MNITLTNTLLIILIGLILGMLYFNIFERFNIKSLPQKCFSVMHYLNKEFSPLYAVHLKSILTGIILILCVLYDYGKVVIFLGASIIGLHISQFMSEYNIVNTL